MAVNKKAGGRYFGLTADTKPTLTTLQAGAEFYEKDGAFDKFVWSGTAWEQLQN